MSIIRLVVAVLAAVALVPATAGAQGGAAKSDSKIWENYDFVPGSKVIFYTDFSEDRVGNFARGLKYVSGPAEIVERGAVKMLRSTGPSTFLIPVGRALPQRFTLEIDVIAPTEAIGGYDYVAIEGGSELDRGEQSAEVNWTPEGSLIMGGGQDVGTSEKRVPEAEAARALGQVTHLRILMDSAYFKMYANEKRLYNIPVLQFRRDSVIRVLVKGGEEQNQATFLTSIRVAESDADVMYDALTTKGRWITQGILFATGKADLQPESRPVLREIAGTLKKYGDLKILIEGHTDNVGSPATNLTLSDARAAAVKATLVSDFGVDAGRITTKGLGDTKPAVPNTTAAGRAQNRRVEIVKQ
ncbi:MAG TPA: OmpA family protein [Gemmatimonadales bacterium]|nr:OmpA family protein [Gemmatimonadales bacterium]